MKRLLLLLSVLLLLPGCASTSGKKEVSPEQVTYKESEKYDLTDEFYEKQNWERNHSIIRCCLIRSLVILFFCRNGRQMGKAIIFTEI